MLKPERLRPGDKAAIVPLSRGSLGKPAFPDKLEPATRLKRRQR